jgi:hypothetical protein
MQDSDLGACRIVGDVQAEHIGYEELPPDVDVPPTE